MEELNKALVALQNTIIHMGRPLFVIESKNYKIVCDTPLSRMRLGVYSGMTLQEALGDSVSLSYLKNHVIKNDIANEIIEFSVVEVIPGYHLVIPNLVKTIDYLEILANDLFYDSTDIKVIVDANDKIVACNTRFEEVFGYKNEEIKHIELATLLELSHSERAYIEGNRQTVNQGNDVVVSGIRKSKQGKRHRVSITFTPIMSKKDVIGIQVTYKLRNSIDDIDLLSYKRIIDNHTDGVIIANKDKKIIYVNKAMCNMFQYHSSEFEKMTFLDKSIMSFSEPHIFDEMLEEIKNTDAWQGESWEKRRDSTIIPTWKQIFIIRDLNDNIIRYVATYKDLSKTSTANLSKMINQDPLTSLYTKQYFINRVDQALKKDPSNQKILFLDIDNFKELNDKNGHILGDKLLVEVSKRIVEHFNGQLKARYAGDEFVVYFSNNLTEDETLNMIKSFDKIIKEPIMIEGKSYVVSVSMGLSISPTDGNTSVELLDSADKNMYINKNANRRI